jgi:phosphatidylserine/phosphatidylglycerophosphate/cardiolipin synthase-like enzyme
MVRIGKSPLDMEFRRVVAARLASARKEVLVVTGEFSAFSNYIELQLAVRDAAMRGVRFEIYSNTFLPGVARKLKRWGCVLYTGAARSNDHFMVVDGADAVVSQAHPPGSCGDRRGFTTRKGAPGYRALFRRLTRSGRRIQRVRGPDPLDGWLSTPAWTEAPVDTSRMDGDLGQV